MRAGATPILLYLLLGGCLEPPVSFEPVSLEQARALVAGGQVVLVDAVGTAHPEPDPLPGSIRWRIVADQPLSAPELPAGELLLIGSSQEVGYRAAALLATARDQSVRVFIPIGAEQRRSLYASPAEGEETHSGGNSRRDGSDLR